MKIVRVLFTLGSSNKEYFFDRQYTEKDSDQQNCDQALNYIIGAVKDGDAIAVLKEVQKKVQPVILNLKQVTELNIVNVGVYQTQEAPTPAPIDIEEANVSE